MDRRTFMKLMGGLASMPIVGRIAKPLKSETVQEGIAAISDKGMELYEMVIAKVMKEGKKIGESGRVDSYKHPDRPDITVDVNQTDGSAEIYFDTDQGSKGFAEIRRDMETGGDELIEAEEVYKFFGKDGEDYVKDVEEGISGGITNLEEFTKIKKAMGGRVGYQTGGRATTQDFAKALKSVSAGTTYQQQRQAKDYARQEAANELRAAIQGGGIDSFLQGAGLNQYRSIFTDTRPGTNRQGAFTGTYNVRKEQLLNDLMNKKLQPTSYAPKPRPKTYRTVSPEAQALNMSQSTYEDIIRSGADPKQYYMDYQNRIMAGNPNLLKYGQVIGAPGMMSGIAGPGMGPGATPPTQAQINQMISNNPMGYADFDALVKTYSADPYKGLKEEIKDMVDGRDTGYMSAQDYYDINVLGLDGKGIAEKYGLQYADGGAVDLTIITMPDISGSGVESLFKTR